MRTPDSFKSILQKAISATDTFTHEDAQAALEHLLDPASTHPAQIGSFLTAIHLNGLERRPDVLAGAASVLRKHCLPAIVNRGEGVEEIDEDGRRRSRRVVDIVGTGGDGHDTFNVSTTSAIVAAGAGARVYKHGNRASTSSSGSADLLQALGCPLSPPSTHARIPASQHPYFNFLLAPNYHPLLAPLASVRKALPHRTLLNLLGPLVNPARPSGMVLGVATPDLGPVFAQALACDDAIEHALVVCGAEHLDEISIAGDTHVWEVKREAPPSGAGAGAGTHEELSSSPTIREYTIHPSDFGLPVHHLSAVAGGSPADNSAYLIALLSIHPTPEFVQPVCDYVLLNAAALLVVSGLAEDWKEGVQKARESIDEMWAWHAFTDFKKFDRGEA